MDIFKIWALVGFIFLIIEITTPTMFFLPLAGGALFAAVVAFKFPEAYWPQALTFALFSAFVYFALRPFIKKREENSPKTGVDAKYINNEALVTQDIAHNTTGEIKIYGETWQAKSLNNEEIKAGEQVVIVKNESIIMYVEKLNKE